MTFDAFIGGLIGSLATVLATKLLDLFQKSKEHKYALQRTFFEKKLAVAEKAFSQLYSNASSMSALSALYEKFSVPDKRAGGEVFETFNRIYSERLSKVEEALKDISNSLFLYFDFDLDKLKNKEPMKRFYDILMDIQDLRLTYDVLGELSEQSKGTDYLPCIEADREKTLHQILPKLKELSIFLDESQDDVFKLLKSLRHEMKKYEI